MGARTCNGGRGLRQRHLGLAEMKPYSPYIPPALAIAPVRHFDIAWGCVAIVLTVAYAFA